MKPENLERAERIDSAMQAYCLSRDGQDFECYEEDVIDMMTDLQHFCERMEINFANAVRIATNHYVEER